MPPLLPSVRALLTTIVDYAGLFPPAKLDMANTVRNYAKYLRSDEAWMLGRLIIPAGRLAEFEEHARDLLPAGDDPDHDPWQISALVDASQLVGELELIEAFNDRHAEGGLAAIDVIELRADASKTISAALDEIPGDLFPFFEVPIDRDPRGLIAAMVEGDAGAKVRTGGISAEAYPAINDLAQFIAACAGANVPFKATAGLHHPLRHFSREVNAQEFGFLNVFVAGCLAQEYALTVAEIESVLDEDKPDAFVFDDQGLSWREHRLDVAGIEEARESFAVSFGSCSFDEPLEDLRRLGLFAQSGMPGSVDAGQG